MRPHYTIVVFSHLRWDFVLQRPQHLLTRLSAQHPVIFIEEPVRTEDGEGWDCSRPEPGILVCRPRTRVPDGGFSAAQLEVLEPMVAELVRREAPDEIVAWFYTPMALPLAGARAPVAVVYDCMDELSLFQGAPPELISREQELLDAADVVFTGGPSLFEAKRGRHPNVHCFPSSVDAAHFHQALSGLLVEPPDQASLPHPRLGFYGVIDERLDLGVLDRLATAHPEWQVVMVGPVVKIDPASLPRHPNILYTGQRGYGELPGYLAGWDVCLLPFARNESTRFISPTKTLEYMVAERPIVSTPIRDVAEPYGQIVYLAETPDEFVRACETALMSSRDERERRAGLMRRVIERTSWDRTASAMEQLIDEAVARRARLEPQAS
jgi:UDP-galactopyranose mutase